MSRPDHVLTSPGAEKPQPPLISAADVDPANYPRVHFDQGISWAVNETARQRAPTTSSEQSHRDGFAGELGVASYFGVKANWKITDDWVGDDGYDFKYNGKRVEVKTTTKAKDWELVVPINKIDSADYYVLAQCPRGGDPVQLIGWTTRYQLQVFGQRFDGKLRTKPTHLLPFEPIELFPDQIRESQIM